MDAVSIEALVEAADGCGLASVLFASCPVELKKGVVGMGLGLAGRLLAYHGLAGDLTAGVGTCGFRCFVVVVLGLCNVYRAQWIPSKTSCSALLYLIRCILHTKMTASRRIYRLYIVKWVAAGMWVGLAVLL